MNNHKILNSNLLSSNGLALVEGAKVFRTSQDDYTDNGEFIIVSADKEGHNNEPLIELSNLDGSRPSWRWATPDELRVLARGGQNILWKS